MKGRFSSEIFEPMRWHVYDAKYKDTSLCDLSPDVLKEFKHGECGCREFRFHVKVKKTRTTCVHLDFLIEFLKRAGPVKRIAPFRAAD